MKVKLKEISFEHKEKLHPLLVGYFKEIDPSKIIESGGKTEVDYPYLDLYWKDSDRIPLFVNLEKEIIGFVLINSWTECKEFDADRAIAEFYIQKAYRRKGIGKRVAFEIFNKFKCSWEIKQSLSNHKAVEFWRKTIEEYTDHRFSEIKNDSGVLFSLF
ncbi:GNAT family N-acetyltransferase [Saprospiraceae bacterium]|nr:GNAT family N-acetyltransferase [Saprospiraceae bacterium]